MAIATNPRLSVIMTTHKRPELLRRAIRSIKKAGGNIQIVLCSDEGSSETRHVAAEELEEHDIFMVLPCHRGPAATRNIGMDFATGDFISFLDDDDTIDSAFVRDFLPELTPNSVHFGNYRKIFETIDSSGALIETRRAEKSTSRKNIENIQVRNFIQLGALCVPSDIARKASFNPELTISEDWEFMLQLYKNAPFQHHEITVTNWHFLDSGQASRDKGGKKERLDNCRIIYDLHPTVDPSIIKGRCERLKDLGA